MKRKKGFSILESVISFGLIIITAIVLLNVFSTSRVGSQLSENHFQAAALGKSLLNDCCSVGFNKVTPSSGTYRYRGMYNGAPISQDFTYTVEIESIDTDKKAIWATIKWTESTGNKKLVVETLLVNPEAK